MAFDVYTSKIPNIIWKIDVPATKQCESPLFAFQDSTFYFSFYKSFKSRGREFWTFFLHQVLSTKQSRESFSPFGVLINIVNIYGHLEKLGNSMTSFSNCDSNIVVYHNSVYGISRYYPDVFLCKDVTFVFTFDFTTYSIQNILNATGSWKDFKCSSNKSINHKMIQTSSVINEQSCLESLSMDFKKLLDDNTQYDVELKCGGQIVLAHKLILSARSEVFSAMLRSDMAEKNRGSIEIVDMEFPVLDQFINYLYTGHVGELTENNALQLYEASDKYSVMALRKQCSQFLKKNLNEKNVCSLLSLSNAHSDDDLKEYIISFIVENEIHQNNDEWQEFSIQHPNVAIEVLNEAYKSLKCSSK